jgi:GNAT superfamily N-acetyltransferase
MSPPTAPSNQSTLSIDVATDADLPAVLALYAQPEMDDGEVLGLDQARAMLSRMRRVPDYELYVARDAAEIVGTFALLILPNLGHAGAPSGVIEDIVVASDRQGQGIGRAMIEYAMRCCAGHGCYKLMLSSNLRRIDAHAFYERLGFERHGYSYRITIPQ